MAALESWVNWLNGLLFSNPVIITLLIAGVLFTIWSGFGQYRALTHGIGVVRGKYDDKSDPGAINHFQALSAALSATVGLGNIGGVAAAVILGGPGAIFWMWIIGLVGMALKMTEVTMAMLYRNTDDPENPHGGPMFVVRDGLKKWGLGPLGSIYGGFFCITLLASAITGGNMFQSWNVAEVTTQYIEIPRIAVGIILAVVVGLVIIGGIKRIGAVAGRIVPFMCLVYVVAGLYVIFLNIGDVPGALGMIVRAGLGMEEASAGGAFLGASFGVAISYGIQRALFSSEAGQGSSPIAHSAAKTKEPVREGVVAGLEPFIDTLVVCTITALVIMLSGAWDRGPEASIADRPAFERVMQVSPTEGESFLARTIMETDTETVFHLVGAPEGVDPVRTLQSSEIASVSAPDRDEDGEPDNLWVPTTVVLPARTVEARRVSGPWKRFDKLMVVVGTGEDNTPAQIIGDVRESGEDDLVITWNAIEAENEPTWLEAPGEPVKVFGYYVAAGLTAHAFDRVTPGLGQWLIMGAAWLFALSTMISWSYYGEQGVYYLFGRAGGKFVLPYRILYCGLIVVAALPFIKTEDELNTWTTLGLGLMLVANIPIMLVFGSQAMSAYHSYFRRMKAGELDPPHEPPAITDVVEGKDVE
jgi:AGCS family alanine or glycine:cation symporter